jgi:CTP:molybdopterin cytidylyltransferase MocA
VIAGLILAAGEGVRFGPEPKLLAELDGRPLLEHAIAAQCSVASLERIVVVLGAHADELRERVDFMRAEPVVCSRWRDGQGESLRRGLQELAGATKVIVTLGDQPLVGSEVVARFVRAPPGARAVYHGRPGHPAVLGPVELAAVLGDPGAERGSGALRGDRGAREFLHGPEVELGDLGDLDRDVDTPADLERIRHEVRAVV